MFISWISSPCVVNEQLLNWSSFFHGTIWMSIFLIMRLINLAIKALSLSWSRLAIILMYAKPNGKTRRNDPCLTRGLEMWCSISPPCEYLIFSNFLYVNRSGLVLSSVIRCGSRDSSLDLAASNDAPCG